MSSTTSPIQGAHIRIARPTDNIEALKPFYLEGLGFTTLYEAQNHNGFDVWMVGHVPQTTFSSSETNVNSAYHLELIHARARPFRRQGADAGQFVGVLPT